MTTWVIGWCALALLAGLAVVGVWVRLTYAVILVNGESMAPGLANGERLLARRVSRSALRPGQIVVVVSPLATTGRFLVKRVAALPGDPVPSAVRTSVAETHVPEGRVVLLGDNTDGSYDSRVHGYFALADIRATTIRRLSPTPSPHEKGNQQNDRSTHVTTEHNSRGAVRQQAIDKEHKPCGI